jgi:hypothetical protein
VTMQRLSSLLTTLVLRCIYIRGLTYSQHYSFHCVLKFSVWLRGCQLQGQERTCSSFKYFEESLAIAVGGNDINIALLVKLRKFIKVECMAGLWSMEWLGASQHLQGAF